MSGAPDAELLEQFARNQSEAAFAELVERYIGLVYSTGFRKTDNPQQAEDITQAVFIILARKAGSLGPKTVLPGWLYHTARLTAANLQRAEARRSRREQEAFMQSTMNETDTTPDALWRELSPLLEDAMAGLGATDRDAIVLRFFQNRSLAEVGAALGASEDAAKMRVSRALEKLRKFFNKRGVVSTTAVIAGAISGNSVQAAPAALAKSVTAVGLAKGAGAGGATLALARGTLNFVSWAKATLLAGTVTVAAVAAVGSITFMSSWFHVSSGTIDDQIAQVTLPGTTIKDLIRVMGEPSRYWIGYKTLDKNHLPDSYLVSYPNVIQASIWKGRVVELECVAPGPGFSYGGTLRLGSTLDDVLRVLGPPAETISGHPANNFMPHHLSGLGGVLYTEIGGQKGESYYWRPDQGIRFMFKQGIVWEICVDVPNYWPPNK